MSTARLEGWEARLLAVVEAARARPYVLGEHDCFRFACAAVEALTGVDRWPQWQGRYATKREALALLARHGASFEAAFDWFFGTARVDPRLARRGDVLAIEDEAGEKHLAVCLGVEAAGLTDSGLVFVPTLSCLCAWRVG